MSNEGVNNWFRWLAVLPGSLLAGLLATFPLHWVLLATFEYGQIISGIDTKPIEYLLYPFVIAAIFVYTGSRIAPKYRFKTSIVLFVIYLLLWITANVIVFLHIINIPNAHFDARSVLALTGAVVGLYWAKKKTDIEKNTIQNNSLDSESDLLSVDDTYGEDEVDLEKLFEMSDDLSTENKTDEELEVNLKRTGNFWEYSKTMNREEALDVYNMWLLHIKYYHPKLDILFEGVTIPTFFLPVPMELLQEVPRIIKEYKNKDGIYENEESMEDSIGKYADRYYPRFGSDEKIMKGLCENLNNEQSYKLLMSEIKNNKDDWYFEYKEV